MKASSFKTRYGDVFNGDANWKKVKLVKGQTYQWDIGSTYVKNPPYFDGMKLEPAPVQGHQGRARAGAVRRFHHHRPHLARRQHQGDGAGRRLSVRTSGVRRRISIPMARAAAITK